MIDRDPLDQLKLFIDGRWCDSDGQRSAVMDAATGRVLGHARMATEREIDAAVDAARRALIQAAPVTFLHHTSWEVVDVEEVGRGAHAMLAEHPERHVWGIGRHWIGSNFFYYLHDPAGNMSEYYLRHGRDHRRSDLEPRHLGYPQEPQSLGTCHASVDAQAR
jgi:hypothetical protein